MVKEKLKSFDKKSCLIIKLEYNVALFCKLFLIHVYALLFYEQQTPQQWCPSSHHSIACDDYKRNIYENTSSVCKMSKCWKITY